MAEGWDAQLPHETMQEPILFTQSLMIRSYFKDSCPKSDPDIPGAHAWQRTRRRGSKRGCSGVPQAGWQAAFLKGSEAGT